MMSMNSQATAMFVNADQYRLEHVAGGTLRARARRLRNQLLGFAGSHFQPFETLCIMATHGQVVNTARGREQPVRSARAVLGEPWLRQDVASWQRKAPQASGCRPIPEDPRCRRRS